MGARGPIPKPAATRQRRNKTHPGSTLPSAESSAKNRVPPLPGRVEGWHPMVTEWWQAVWQSPMASEYLDADMRGGLYLLADLHQARWTADDAHVLVKVASEIRLQEVRFGLSPIDRRRLQWEVEKGDAAAERTESRRSRKKTPAETGKDPRDVLKAMS
jgi:hypothetical protein